MPPFLVWKTKRIHTESWRTGRICSLIFKVIPCCFQILGLWVSSDNLLQNKALQIHLNSQHFNKWDEHTGTSDGKIQLAAFHFSGRQSWSWAPWRVQLSSGPGDGAAALLGALRPAEDGLALFSAVLGTLQMSGTGTSSFSPFNTGFNHQFVLIKNCFTIVFFFLLNKIQVAVKLSLIHRFLVPSLT